jgi:hypothetical protein
MVAGHFAAALYAAALADAPGLGWFPARARQRVQRAPVAAFDTCTDRHTLAQIQGGRRQPAEMALVPRRHPLNLIRVMPAKGETAVSTSTYLARLIGPVLLAAAIGMFLNREGYKAMAQEFLRSPALLYLSGLLTMTAGVAIVLAHNLWVADWRVLITIFGWLGAIGGAARIALPGATKAVGERMLAKPTWMTVGGVGWLAIGALLTLLGYFG